MGAASTVLTVVNASPPPPFEHHTSDGRLELQRKKLSSHSLSCLADFVYFSNVHTLVLDGMLLRCHVCTIKT